MGNLMTYFFPPVFATLLTEWKLKQFAPKFKEFGWDDADDWYLMTGEELMNEIGLNRGHLIRFKKKYKACASKKGINMDNNPRKQPIEQEQKEENKQIQPTSHDTMTKLIKLEFAKELALSAAANHPHDIDKAIMWIHQQQKNSKA
eukprot:225900_1